MSTSRPHLCTFPTAFAQSDLAFPLYTGRQYAVDTSRHIASIMLYLYATSLERSALLPQIAIEEKSALDSVQTVYEEERERVEEEWKRGHDRIRARESLLEGIEERRRRARACEEKSSEGTGDSHSRPHITRKLRNKPDGSSPPPPPLTVQAAGLATTIVPVTNPLPLSVNKLPSPFSLPLTATVPLPDDAGNGNDRCRAKGGASLPSLLLTRQTRLSLRFIDKRRGSCTTHLSINIYNVQLE